MRTAHHIHTDGIIFGTIAPATRLADGLLVLALLACAPAAAAADPAVRRLANEKLTVHVSETGTLRLIENRLAAEAYAVDADAFEVDTDLGMLTNREAKPIAVQQHDNRIVYRFVFDRLGNRGTSEVTVDLVYALGSDTAFFRRTLHISNRDPLRVENGGSTCRISRGE